MGRKKQTTDRPADPAKDVVVKTAVNLASEAHKRLASASLFQGRDRSTIVNELIMLHLSGYYVGFRPRAEAGEAEAAA